MSPLTRFRASDDHVPLPIVAEYYAQRASTLGTLLITEATYIAPEHSGYPNAPGIYNDAQTAAWKTVTDAVHKKGSFIFLQLWALGRAAGNTDFAGGDHLIKVVSSSAVPLEADYATPHALTIDEIKHTVQQYAAAAKNAVRAGFDGVEIHGANGYLIDQFIQDTCNQRTDAYGGSYENRSRFAVEVAQAVAKAVGPERTSIRLSPFSKYQKMGMPNAKEQFGDLLGRLNGLNLAYVHLIDSRIMGNVTVERTETLDFAFEAYQGNILVAGGNTPELAKKLIDEDRKERNVAVVFGRYFISNPDLVFRIQNGLALNEYDRKTFYDAKNVKGYLDYPFSAEYLATKA